MQHVSWSAPANSPAERSTSGRHDPPAPSDTSLNRNSQSVPPGATADTLEERLRAALSPNLLLVREIGVGGMARVFLAREPALKRLVAVKVLSGELAASPEGRARFEREAQAVAGLSHPNIVAVHAVGELADGTPYFVMQYVEGRSMAARVEGEGPLSLAEARRALGEVAAALAAAHQQGIIHRDIKRANILYEDATGRSLVSDFGIAAMGPGTAPNAMRLTGTGVIIGTPRYMSPEQLLAEPVSEKTDIYSLGLLAHELLVGSAPFRASSPHELIAAHLRDLPARLAQRGADVDPELDELIARCLEKEASKRPTAAEVARRLAPGGAALLEWPPPGLEDLHGRMRWLSNMHWLGGGLVTGAMLTIVLAGPRMSSALVSPVSLLFLLAAMAGVLLLFVAIRRTIHTGLLTSRAIRNGYAWLTVLETLADSRGDTGNIITGSREYAALKGPQRDRFRMYRLCKEGALLVGGVVAVPILLIIVVLGSAGRVGAGTTWLPAATLLLALVVALLFANRERRAFAAQRRRKSAALQSDVSKLSAPWYESFEAVREGQSLGRGRAGASNAGRVGAIAVSVVLVAVVTLLVPLAVVGTLGPTLWTLALPHVADTKAKVEIARVTRPYGVAKDTTITPLAAGQAFYALQYAAGDQRPSRFPENAPPIPLLARPPWRDSMPTGLFPTARPDHTAGIPAVLSIFPAMRRGLSGAELVYLARIAHAPQWKAFEVVARARSIDYVGARYRLPFPNGADLFSFPIPRFVVTKELAYASVSRAAFYLSRGQRDSAETTLRQTISLGFLLVDEGTTLIEQLIGVVIAGIGRSGLIDYYKSIGDPRGALLQTKLDSAVAAFETRSDVARSPQLFSDVDARDVGALRAAIRYAAGNTTELRGQRMEMLMLLAMAPCTNLRELVFGPNDEVNESFARARKTLARFASDSAMLDVIFHMPEGLASQPIEAATSNERSRAIVRVARVAGAVLRNPRLVGCSTLLTSFGR